MGKRLTTKDFIQRARKVHGNKYNYSKVEYVNSRTKVIIICSEHGVFEQTPDSHINRQHGCDKCAVEAKKQKLSSNTEEFIQKAREKHGDKYDYSKTEYVNAKTKVKIICLKHGVFEQEPESHLQGCGCRQCVSEGQSKSQAFTTEQFIEQAKTKYGNKYDYSQVEYINNHTKVKIRCIEHDYVFEQIPTNHLHGNCGCKKCISEKRSKCKISNTDEFIQKAIAKHGNKYDYSEIEYKNNHTKVKIICPIHGEFEQTPNNHLSGKGCGKCARIHGFKTRKNNGTLNTSQSEEDLYKLLVDKFGVDNVIRQFRDKIRYPFNCDFYIKSLDLFIELNANWTHGRGLGFYDENNPEHQKQLEDWKNEGSKYYKNAIQTWTQRDFLKKKTAIKNNLNYLVFWDNDLSDAKKWLNSIE